MSRRACLPCSDSQILYKGSIVSPSPTSFLLHHTLTHPHQPQAQVFIKQTFQTFPIQTNKTITMESIKQGANYVSETVQQAASGTSKEANKEVAKDSNASIGTR